MYFNSARLKEIHIDIGNTKIFQIQHIKLTVINNSTCI